MSWDFSTNKHDPSVGWSLLIVIVYGWISYYISSIDLRQCSTQPNPQTNFSRLILIKLCLTNGFARILKFAIIHKQNKLKYKITLLVFNWNGKGLAITCMLISEDFVFI